MLTELLHAPRTVQEGQVLSCVALLFMNQITALLLQTGFIFMQMNLYHLLC